ncbi:uncharacterized protein [Battus philenor]|uniref:uncharacterized protein isoform X2 n=1 Tax=Battus philenor TaxID=42288 RepID=UPI0035CFDAF8
MIECIYCKKVFKYESERKRHEQSHLTKFSCDKCDKKFSYISALRRHKKQHERTGSVKCEECGHKFKDEVLLKRHMKYAHEGTHICPVCDSQFSSDQALRIHAFIHKPKSERRYSCSFSNCNKMFNFSHHLKYHEMTHTKSIQHFCDICGKGFIQLHNLKVHLITHEPNKWLSCGMINCKKKFKSEYARKRHYEQHKNVLEDTKKHDSNSNKSLSGGEGKEEESEKEDLIHDFNGTEEYISTCRSILGKCLVTGDTKGNENCLCDQMAKTDNECSTRREENTAQSIKTQVDTKKEDNTSNLTCKDCVCSTGISEEKHVSYNKETNQKRLKGNFRNDCKPKYEYGVNGTIKIINTIDEDLEGIAKSKDITNSARKLATKICCTEIQNVPYNSCKAVLGTCIVSGNGMIGDDCLCAKMLLDESQISSQEMEEITPQPKEAGMCL